MTMQHIGQVHQQRGELTEALEYFDHALQLQLQQQQQAENTTTTTTTTSAASLAQTLNHIGNVHLQRGHAVALVDALSQAVRYLHAAGKTADDLAISGFNFYGLSKLHPECAAVA
jgi:tetratricopeptide (TPR) repeat protein